jgi:hypothetical protein
MEKGNMKNRERERERERERVKGERGCKEKNKEGHGFLVGKKGFGVKYLNGRRSGGYNGYFDK